MSAKPFVKDEALPLATQERQLATQREQPSVALMLQTMIEKGITEASVAAFAQLVALQERMEERQAEKDFAADFIALQKEIPKIEATAPVPGKNGEIKYYFAKYEAIMEQLQPLLEKYGFAVTFGNKVEGTPQRIVSICTLIHRGGHSKTTEFGVRIGSGPPGCTESQADGSAASYAKRYALCHALNIQTKGIGEDDARAIGGPITQEQADELRRRLNATRGNEAKFLEWAGAAQHEAIPSTKWDAACNILADRERKQAAQKETLL